MTTPRGVRLNNPGNIRLGDLWHGMSQEQMDSAFCTFVAPEWGIRAMAKILLKYQDHGVRSVRQLIERWAPPGDNNPTDIYAAAVAAAAGVQADTEIVIRDHLGDLIAGMIHFEQGQQPYTTELIHIGIGMALV